MTCHKAIRLVEKLADGEANARERSEAQQHLDTCEECTAHYQFVRALESASEKIELPTPPEAYWQQFPSKVLARIEDTELDEPQGFWQKLFTPSAFRLGAALATLILVVAVGSIVYRDDPRLLDPQTPELARRSSPQDVPVPSSGKTASDENAVGLDDTTERDPEQASPARSAGLRSESEPLLPSAPSPPSAASVAQSDERRALEREIDAEKAEDVADDRLQNGTATAALARRRANREAFSPPGEPSESSPTDEGLVEEELAEEGVFAEALSADSVRQQPSPVSREVAPAAKAGDPPSSLASGEAGTAMLASATDPCEEWRLYLAENEDDAPGARDARYQVALCSLRSYDAEPNDETRAGAIRDAEAFLALDDDSDLAEEIRVRVEPLRR